MAYSEKSRHEALLEVREQLEKALKWIIRSCPMKLGLEKRSGEILRAKVVDVVNRNFVIEKEDGVKERVPFSSVINLR